MLRLTEIHKVVEVCRTIASKGLINGVQAFIPELEIDILEPPCDFLGATGNPAIFVNEYTYKLLGGIHETWIANRTIAIKDSFLKVNNMEIIGAIVHETGHAFNVAANIENSEANAYIFEIEMLVKLYEAGSLHRFRCSGNDIKAFFQSRLAFYHMEMGGNPYLTGLVNAIQNNPFNQFQPEIKALVFYQSPTFFFHKPYINEESINSEDLQFLNN